MYGAAMTSYRSRLLRLYEICIQQGGRDISEPCIKDPGQNRANRLSPLKCVRAI